MAYNQQGQFVGGYGQGQGYHQQQQQHPYQHQQQQQHPYQQHYQGLHHNNPPPPASQHYGSYGNQFSQNVYSINAWQAVGYQTEDEFRNIFAAHMSPTYHAIQAEELCKILNETHTIRNYYKISWSLELCKIMLAMLDRSKDGMMQYEEFRELLQCLVYWYQTFCQYDTNRSGFIEARELHLLINTKFGYQLSQKAMECLLKRYSRALDDGRCLIAFDDFVSCSVRLRAYTEAFRARDRSHHNGHETGNYTYSYDDFLQCTMCL